MSFQKETFFKPLRFKLTVKKKIYLKYFPLKFEDREKKLCHNNVKIRKDLFIKIELIIPIKESLHLKREEACVPSHISFSDFELSGGS